MSNPGWVTNWDNDERLLKKANKTIVKTLVGKRKRRKKK